MRVEAYTSASVDALPDTGADISVGGLQFLDDMSEFPENLLPADEHPKAANGETIRSIGVLPVYITLGDVKVDDYIHILPSVTGLLLSWRTTRDLNIIPRDYPRQIEMGTGASATGSNRAVPQRLTTPSTEASQAEHRAVPRVDSVVVPHYESEPTTAQVVANVGDRSRTTGTGAHQSMPDDAVKLTTRNAFPPARMNHGTAATAVAPPTTSEERVLPPTPSRPSEQNAPVLTAFPDVVREFPTIFDGKIRCMPGEEFRIHLRDDAVPFCVTAPRRVSLAYREPLKEELKRLQDQDIIFPVTTPTDWCAPIVVSPKKGGGIRLCVDLSKLNKHVRRERYQSPTPAEEVASIVGQQAQWFTVVDAAKGYHQCILAEESRLLTTFTTPFGRYAFKRAPYGVASISEHYNRRMDEALQGMPPFYRKVVDDVVIFSSSLEEHIQHVREFLSRCEERGISLNLGKLQLAKRSVKFAGFVVSGEGYGPNPQLTEALSAFPTPRNISDLRSFFGLVNQLASFVDNIAELMEPLRPLLKPRNIFKWEDHHQEAFQKMKTNLTSVPTLGFFDPTRPTTLATDASRKKGLGFILRQADADGKWHVIQAGSRFLSDAESRYATIELEALAVCWALEKCQLFVGGLPNVEVLTDHRPLVPILNCKTLDEVANPRLQRLKLRMSQFGQITAAWVPGSQQGAADALSRNPVCPPVEGDECGEDTSAVCIRSIVISELQAHHVDIRLQEVQEAAAADPEYQQLVESIQTGFPTNKAELQEPVKQYWPVRDRLSVDDGIVLCGCRIVIPSSLRRQTLVTLHAGHLGQEKTKSRARQIVYWPGMNNDIDNATRSCERCQNELPSQQRETLVQREPAGRPFQHLDVDIASHAGGKYLVTVDCFSGWRHVEYLGIHTSTARVKTALLKIFRQVGVPEGLWSDGGPEFTSYQFRDFLQKWGITHKTSSPHYPQSNGRAESGVKAAKKLLRRCWDLHRCRLDDEAWTRGVLQHWNTPGIHGASPAQLIYGRPIRDNLPTHHSIYQQKPPDAFGDRRQEYREKVKDRYDSRARDLPEFSAGTRVRVQDPRSRRWERCGTVIAAGPHRRYRVRFDDGGEVDRNRCHLRRRYAIIGPEPGAPDAVEARSDARTAPREPAREPVREPARAREAPPPLRRSTRIKKRTKRLIEEI